MLGVVGSNLKQVKFFMQHLWMLHDVLVVWPSSCNIVAPGHIPGQYPTCCNMLRPTMLRYVAFKCCDRFVGALSKMVTSLTCENKIFEYRFMKDNMQNVYLLLFTATRDTKLIWFQYKVIHNILLNQVSLFRADIAKNDTCPLCNTEK